MKLCTRMALCGTTVIALTLLPADNDPSSAGKSVRSLRYVRSLISPVAILPRISKTVRSWYVIGGFHIEFGYPNLLPQDLHPEFSLCPHLVTHYEGGSWLLRVYQYHRVLTPPINNPFDAASKPSRSRITPVPSPPPITNPPECVLSKPPSPQNSNPALSYLIRCSYLSG